MIGLGRVAILLACLLGAAGCRTTVPSYQGPRYQAPPAAAGETALIANSSESPGLGLVDYWAFVRMVDGYPVVQPAGSLEPTVVMAGVHLLNIGCKVGRSEQLATIDLQAQLQADHTYVVECHRVSALDLTRIVTLRDKADNSLLAQGEAQ